MPVGCRVVLAALARVALLAAVAARAAEQPRMLVNPAWPKPLPSNWVLWHAAGVAIVRGCCATI